MVFIGWKGSVMNHQHFDGASEIGQSDELLMIGPQDGTSRMPLNEWRMVTGPKRVHKGPKRPLFWWLADLFIHHVYRALAWATMGRIGPAVSVTALILSNDQLLLIDRSDGHGICLPGGMVRAYEELEDAVCCEVLEETGYLVKVDDLLGIYGAPQRDPRLHAINIVYRAHIVSGHAQSSLEGHVFWCPVQEWPVLQFAFDHDQILLGCLPKIKE
jgi:ADP-ribose pyrophosphatase YjhB (NUDIX family)